MNSCCEAAVTVTVGDRSMQDGGMLSGVSDGFDRLQQHSEIDTRALLERRKQVAKYTVPQFRRTVF